MGESYHGYGSTEQGRAETARSAKFVTALPWLCWNVTKALVSARNYQLQITGWLCLLVWPTVAGSKSQTLPSWHIFVFRQHQQTENRTVEPPNSYSLFSSE